MRVKDVMTTDVATISGNTRVGEIAKLLVENHISALPVIDGDNRVIGVVSEGDLLRRMDAEAEEHPSWWMSIVARSDELSEPVVRFRGLVARDVMTSPAITVEGDRNLGEVADLLIRKRIKRVPVIGEDTLVGIVSRTDLLAAFAGIVTGGSS